ncbi:MAG: DNA polymerase III subunit gamma/tau [bacterium JZ-2024 1]
MESLYRKYRPQTFEEIVGQRTIVRSLQNALNLNRLSHAYIFSGPRGTGKTTTARLLAKALNCLKYEHPTPSPCNDCASCKGITTGDSPDVKELDAASRTSVDDIRELIESVRYKPVISRFRVYILDEAHMLSRSAFNALLKTLEEPPPFVVFILATTEPNKLPPTVISRCQRFDFARLNEEDFTALINRVIQNEGFTVADDRFISLLYQYAGGAARDGLSLLEQVALYSGNVLSEKALAEVLGVPETHLVIRLLEALVNDDATQVLQCAQEGYSSGASFWTFLNVWTSVVRDVLAIKMGQAPSLLYEERDRKRLESIALRASTAMLVDAMEKQGDYRFTYKWESEGRLLWDMVFVSLLADFHAVRAGRGRALPGRRSAETPPSEPLPVGTKESPATQSGVTPSSESPDSRDTERKEPQDHKRPAPAKEPSPSAPVESLLFAQPPSRRKTRETGSGEQSVREEPPPASGWQEAAHGDSPATAVLARDDGEALATLRTSDRGGLLTPDLPAPSLPDPAMEASQIAESPHRIGSAEPPDLSNATVRDVIRAPIFPPEWPAFLEWLEDRDLILAIFLAQAERVEYLGNRLCISFPADATISYRELLPPQRRRKVREAFEEFSGLHCDEIDLERAQVDTEKWRDDIVRLVRTVFPESEVAEG